ncbi:haloacid dehalogenase type II [Alteromonas sp. ASW11-19]|uniref:(S)-2-haloacid dehalogenase n=1 Tax=Alteromonas salexigens TaxID=2982530 RepID=A0ABT2VRW7_9ALTE|nr:haloacid dehalogenase type II [Alteromonas salexigens]MCU7554654.1 haloacid dehalogenase type II [Alteromonas salexigens]
MIRKPQTLFFDVNETLLDMNAVREAVGNALGDENLVPVWFSTLLHYSLVEMATDSFHDFAEIGAAALVMTANANGKTLELADAQDIITEPMTSLPPHEDVAEGLEALRNEGFQLVALSNSAAQGLDKQLRYAGVYTQFDKVLSVQNIRTYKPYPKVYEWAMEQAGVTPSQAMMIAAHGWDIMGAAACGMQTAFVSRPGKMPYPLAPAPNLEVASLPELLTKLTV